MLNRPGSGAPALFSVDDAFESKEETLPAIRSLVRDLFQGKSACIFCSNHLHLPGRGGFSPTLGLALIELSQQMAQRRHGARVTISVTSFELFSGDVYDLLSPLGGGALEVEVGLDGGMHLIALGWKVDNCLDADLIPKSHAGIEPELHKRELRLQTDTNSASPQIIGLTEVEAGDLSELNELFQESADCRTRFALIRGRKMRSGGEFSFLFVPLYFSPSLNPQLIAPHPPSHPSRKHIWPRLLHRATGEPRPLNGGSAYREAPLLRHCTSKRRILRKLHGALARGHVCHAQASPRCGACGRARSAAPPAKRVCRTGCGEARGVAWARDVAAFAPRARP